MSRCNQCEALVINGVFCHETGCPNSKWHPRSRKKLVKVHKPGLGTYNAKTNSK